MGRKGVSKRKPSQTKSKPFSSDKSGSTVSSVLTPLVGQAVKSKDSSTSSTFPDRKKKSRNG